MSNIEDLPAIMAKLQDPKQGRSWKQTQTLANIAPYTIEGGLLFLFQMLFYAQLAQEQGWFDFTAIIATIKEKIIRRHSHIFGGNRWKSA